MRRRVMGMDYAITGGEDTDGVEIDALALGEVGIVVRGPTATDIDNLRGTPCFRGTEGVIFPGLARWAKPGAGYRVRRLRPGEKVTFWREEGP
jgi:hypothetical protein